MTPRMRNKIMAEHFLYKENSTIKRCSFTSDKQHTGKILFTKLTDNDTTLYVVYQIYKREIKRSNEYEYEHIKDSMKMAILAEEKYDSLDINSYNNETETFNRNKSPEIKLVRTNNNKEEKQNEKND